ncbi:substrate-binding domain-containing protein [Streptomyces sp. YH02]|uniref:substrate-binding domain-containing protein n=1 Tax=Streptomyces sp. YH02 TaxID=3256999 RepID=UPI0037583B14
MSPHSLAHASGSSPPSPVRRRTRPARRLRIRHRERDEDSRRRGVIRTGDPTPSTRTTSQYALTLIQALKDAELRVPEDIAVIGSDNLPLGAALRPHLTTTYLDLSPAGRTTYGGLPPTAGRAADDRRVGPKTAVTRPEAAPNRRGRRPGTPAGDHGARLGPLMRRSV